MARPVVRAALVSACVLVGTLVLAPSALASSGEAELRPGETLRPGEGLVSADGTQTLVVQPDGMLALFGAEPDPAGCPVPPCRVRPWWSRRAATWP
jgi:hypothetical protein